MDKELERKEKKKMANKAYYDKIKAKITALDNIKNNTEETETKEQDNFFFQQTQKNKQNITPEVKPPPPEVKPPPQIIVQAPPPVKSSLKNKVLETLVLSFIPMLPLIVKQCITILQTRQQKPQQEQEQQSNMRYVATNLYDF